jgi:hypothetical protein
VTKAGDAYRLAQAQKLIDLYETAHCRPPSSVKEMEDWAATPKGKAILAGHHDEDGKIIP